MIYGDDFLPQSLNKLSHYFQLTSTKCKMNKILLGRHIYFPKT